MHLSTRDMARIGYLMLREGNWRGVQVIPRSWARRIVSVVTPVERMNPEPLRQGPFGYGYMWWVWDGEHARGPFAGGYTARGAFGQYITVLPAIDLVVAHKTVPDATTSWDAYQGILDRLVAARCDPGCN
jgi:CubicO group peptidase (beta-lactamase class C family)